MRKIINNTIIIVCIMFAAFLITTTDSGPGTIFLYMMGALALGVICWRRK